jgi:tripartite-type tricarboxylate transporter receptor subunit TctC
VGQVSHLAARTDTPTTRLNTIPDVPSLAVVGLAGFDFLIWHGLYARRGRPTIVQSLNHALNSSLDDSAIRKRYTEMGRTEFAVQRTPAAHTARLDAEIERLDKLLHEAGIIPEQ